MNNKLFLLIPVDNYYNGIEISREIKGKIFGTTEEVLKFLPAPICEEPEDVLFIFADELVNYLNSTELNTEYWYSYIFITEKN